MRVNDGKKEREREPWDGGKAKEAEMQVKIKG